MINHKIKVSCTSFHEGQGTVTPPEDDVRQHHALEQDADVSGAGFQAKSSESCFHARADFPLVPAVTEVVSAGSVSQILFLVSEAK